MSAIEKTDYKSFDDTKSISPVLINQEKSRAQKIAENTITRKELINVRGKIELLKICFYFLVLTVIGGLLVFCFIKKLEQKETDLTSRLDGNSILSRIDPEKINVEPDYQSAFLVLSKEWNRNPEIDDQGNKKTKLLAQMIEGNLGDLGKIINLSKDNIRRQQGK